jgi:Bacterial low temperature requirement A protein (LtrA)
VFVFYHHFFGQHFYAPPRQRQKWGETQVLPRINWGDLFCDLLYVAASYNISNILVYDATPFAYLYAAGTFFPILHLWVEHALFASRFVNDSDVAHAILRIAALIVIATAILNIRPVNVMSHSSTDISMFVFCLCLGLERCLTLLRYVELYCFGVGQTKNIQRYALVCMCKASLLLVFYMAAMIVAAMKFFPRQQSDMAEYDRLLADTTTTTGDEKTEDSTTTHIPIILCLVGYFTDALLLVIYVVFFIPSGGRHKQL